MKSEIKYIELKSDFNHNGPAWIAPVSYSKSRKTLYFNNKAFQAIGCSRMRGNYYDVETLDEYWISGVKKDMSNRHMYGSGVIQIDKQVLKDYLEIVGQTELQKSKYKTVELGKESPVERIRKFLNEKLTDEKYHAQVERYFQR